MFNQLLTILQFDWHVSPARTLFCHRKTSLGHDGSRHVVSCVPKHERACVISDCARGCHVQERCRDDRPCDLPFGHVVHPLPNEVPRQCDDRSASALTGAADVARREGALRRSPTRRVPSLVLPPRTAKPLSVPASVNPRIVEPTGAVGRTRVGGRSCHESTVRTPSYQGGLRVIVVREILVR